MMTRRTLLTAGCTLLSLLSTSRIDADSLEKLALRISAGSAPVTLEEFVRQTGLQVLFESDAVRNSTTRQISGKLDAREALALMFEGSDLTFEFINERTIAVRVRPHSATTVVAKPTGRM